MLDQSPVLLTRWRGEGRDAVGRWLGPALMAMAALVMLWWSWGTWPDPLIDFGRELYIPWQLTEGRVLYRDIAYLNGPLSPYLNAAWFEMFGVGLRTLVFVNIVIWAVLLCMLYQIMLTISNRISATIACVVFILLFSFAAYEIVFGNYNYVCPYYHEMTHGMVLSVAGLLCVHRYALRRRLAPVAAAGIVAGLVFLTKAEIFIAFACALVAGLGLTMMADRQERSRVLPVLACCLGSALLAPVIALGLLATAMPPLDALQAVFGTWRYILDVDLFSQPFYRRGMGIDEPLGVLVVSAYYGVFLLPAALVAMRIGRRRRAGRVAAAIIFVVAIGVVGGQWYVMPWLLLARPLPLVMIALGATLTVLFFRHRPKPPSSARWILQIMFILFALMLLSKMLFNARIHHYGFVLGMPASLILVAALFDWVPSGLTRLGGCGLVFRSAVLGGAIVIVLAHVNLVAGAFRTETQTIATGADTFRADYRADYLDWAVTEVTQRLQPDQTLAVVPECVMINYLTRRANPSRYHRFDPVVIMLFGELEMLRSLQDHEPDFILIVHADYTEYGYRFFGRDFGLSINAWIESNYETIASHGAPPLRDERFGMRLMRRMDAREGQ